MIVSGMAKSSLVDYPGLVSCVLFLPACNFDCFYCHNRSLIDGTHDVIDLDYVEDFLRKRSGLLDAVVITGGEPTLHKDLLPFIRTIRELGYNVKLDTNGSSPEVVEELIREHACDYYAVDYKAPSHRYAEVAGKGADAGKVLETINLLLASGVDFEVRTTVIPQLSESDLTEMARELPVVPRYVLNPYRKPEKYKLCDLGRIEKTPYTPQQIGKLAEAVRPIQPNVV